MKRALLWLLQVGMTVALLIGGPTMIYAGIFAILCVLLEIFTSRGAGTLIRA